MIKKKWILTLLCSLLVFLYVLVSIQRWQQQIENEEINRLKQSIEKAAVRCYSIEGFYPASVDYLVDHYGIIIDEKHYHVFYEALGSNLTPSVDVIARKG